MELDQLTKSAHYHLLGIDTSRFFLPALLYADKCIILPALLNGWILSLHHPYPSSERRGYKIMKPDIHPQYYPQAKVVCASCGNKFEVGSTQAEIHTEICSNCHPFYTGKQVLIDTAGRVERFQKIVKKAAEKKAGIAARKTAKTKRAAADKATTAKSDVKAESAKSGAKTTLKKIKSEMDKK